MFERRLYFHVDWLLLGAIMVIVGIGVAMIYSTTYVNLPTGGHPGPQVRTQMYALAIGTVALLVCLAIDYRMLAEHLKCREQEYGERLPCHDTVEKSLARLKVGSIKDIFDAGLHEFLTDFIRDNNRLGDEVAAGYRFQ